MRDDYDDVVYSINPNVFSKEHWKVIALENGLCGYCGPHYGENDFTNHANRSWKEYRRYQAKGRMKGELY